MMTERLTGWAKSVKKIGLVPTIVLILFSAVFSGAAWIGWRVIGPSMDDQHAIVSDQLETSATMRDALSRQSASLQATARAMEKIELMHGEESTLHRADHSILEEMLRCLDRMSSRLDIDRPVRPQDKPGT